MKQHDVRSPASSDNFAFEKKVIEVYNQVVSELPDYEFLNTNSNGFAAFLIKKAGGDVDLPYNSYGSDDLSAYELAYTIALNKQISAAMRKMVVSEPKIHR